MWTPLHCHLHGHVSSHDHVSEPQEIHVQSLVLKGKNEISTSVPCVQSRLNPGLPCDRRACYHCVIVPFKVSNSILQGQQLPSKFAWDPPPMMQWSSLSHHRFARANVTVLRLSHVMGYPLGGGAVVLKLGL